MDCKPLPIGVSDFEKLIKNECYYVDKTLMIKDIIDNKSETILFTRPRRFGKTLNMSMIRYFFEDAGTSDDGMPSRAHLFEGLKIMDAGEKYTSQMGRYPVIYLTFKDAKRETFEESYAEIVYEIAHEVSRHGFLLDVPSFQGDRERLEMLIRQKADKTAYGKAIRFLSECLERYYGKKVVVVIDE